MPRIDTTFGEINVDVIFFDFGAGVGLKIGPNLLTEHRRENFGEGFMSMVTAMKDLSEKYPDVDLSFARAC